MRSFSRTRWFANGTNPSPVPRRLEKAPSPDTLSPRERAMISSSPPVSSTRCGTCPAPREGVVQSVRRAPGHYCTCSVRFTEWLRLTLQDVHAPVTVRVYVPWGVPELVGGGAKPPPPPPHATIASATRKRAAQMANPVNRRPVLGRARLRIAKAELPDARRAIVQRSQSPGCGEPIGGGFCCGRPSDDAVVATVTVIFVEVLKVIEAGEAVQLAFRGAPVQVKATL